MQGLTQVRAFFAAAKLVCFLPLVCGTCFSIKPPFRRRFEGLCGLRPAQRTQLSPSRDWAQYHLTLDGKRRPSGWALLVTAVFTWNTCCVSLHSPINPLYFQLLGAIDLATILPLACDVAMAEISLNYVFAAVMRAIRALRILKLLPLCLRSTCSGERLSARAINRSGCSLSPADGDFSSLCI